MSRPYLLVVVLGACGGSTEDGNDPTPGGGSATSWDLVVDGLGGAAVLDAFTGFTYDASGTRYMSGQSPSPFSGADLTSTFDLVVSDDRPENSVRYAWDRIFNGVLLGSYTETCVRRTGYVEGIDDFFFATSTEEMPSSRMSAVTKQHRLLNPHLLALDVQDGSRTVTDAGTEQLDGVEHLVLEVSDAISPIRLLVDPATGRIDRLRVLENDHLRRDVWIDVDFLDWQTWGDGDGPMFPAEVTLSLDGEVVHEEVRSSVRTNPDLPAGRFAFPDGADPEYDTELADYGERSSQFHETFASLGLILDEPDLSIVNVALAPGVVYIGGSLYNSMVVEQANGVVLIEAPLNPQRTEAIIAWIESAFPGKPVTHVIMTHHHTDHSAGVRGAVGVGAALVLSDVSVDLMNRVLAAPSTIVPDVLSSSGLTPVVLPVSGSLTLDDPIHPVTAWQLDSQHASDMLIVQVGSPEGDFVFNSDLWFPGGGGFAFSIVFVNELKSIIEARIGGAPQLVGGHGTFGPYEELVNFVD